MAVRDDFAAGEVLAAADLNDTFASKLPYSYGTATPSTSVDGFLWYDENDTPPTPKFWDGAAFQNVAAAGGLTLITSETFTGVSAVSVNNCFSAAHKRYLIMPDITTVSANDPIPRLVLRAAGSDTTSNYIVRGSLTEPSSVSYSNNTNGDLGRLDSGNEGWSFMEITLRDPFGTRETSGQVQLQYRMNSSLFKVASLGYIQSDATSFDGFTLSISTGTFAGIIRIYGYEV